MTTNEAFELAIEKANELKENGIEVVFRPCNSEDNEEMIEKYNKPENIPPDKWVKVTFENIDKYQAEKIHDAANYLGMCGILFDSGGCSNSRDWELDWSFQYTGQEEPEERKQARDEVEDMINKLPDDRKANEN